MAASTVQTNPLPPAPSAVDLLDSGRPRLISQPWNQWLLQAQQKINVINETLATLSGGSVTPGGELSIISGGTGAGNKTDAFNNLSPLTTVGDMLVYNGGNVRLPISTDGFVLQIISGMPTWVNPSAGSSPLTTKGDIYGYNTAPARIPVGSDTYVLTADSTNPLGVSWKPAGTPTLPVTTKGDILGYSTLPARIPVGIDGQALLADSTQALGVKWGSAGSSSPLTTKGDLYGYSTANARVPVGSDGQVLTAQSSSVTGLSWGTPFSTYTSPAFSYVSSLLHFNGINGSTTFTDQVAGNTWSTNNATISTSQFLFGSSSGYFSGGSNSCIYMPINSGFNVGLGNWSIEFAIYAAGSHQTSARVFQTRDGDTYAGIAIDLNQGTSQGVYLYLSSTGSSFDMLNAALIFTLTTGSFFRFLIQRSLNSIQVFVNGTLSYATAIPGNSIYYGATDSVIIGGNHTGISRSINGYIDEFRFTKGLALVSSYPLATSEFPNS